jgi:hypothetical protein
MLRCQAPTSLTTRVVKNGDNPGRQLYRKALTYEEDDENSYGRFLFEFFNEHEISHSEPAGRSLFFLPARPHWEELNDQRLTDEVLTRYTHSDSLVKSHLHQSEVVKLSQGSSADEVRHLRTNASYVKSRIPSTPEGTNKTGIHRFPLYVPKLPPLDLAALKSSQPALGVRIGSRRFLLTRLPMGACISVFVAQHISLAIHEEAYKLTGKSPSNAVTYIDNWLGQGDMTRFFSLVAVKFGATLKENTLAPRHDVLGLDFCSESKTMRISKKIPSPPSPFCRGPFPHWKELNEQRLADEALTTV